MGISMSIFLFSVKTDTLPKLKANPHFEYLGDVYKVLIEIATLSRRHGMLVLKAYQVNKTNTVKEIDANLIHTGIYNMCHRDLIGKELKESLLKAAHKYNEPTIRTVVPIELRLLKEAKEVQNMIIQALCEIRSGTSPRCLGELLKCCYEININKLGIDDNDTN